MNLGTQQFAATAPFLWGSFTTFSLAEIFGVLALSRQLVAMRFTDEDKDVGAIAVKAGQVIGAEDFRTQTRGADALKALIYDPGTAFAVIMLPRNAPELDTAPVIGKLAALLPEVASPREAAEKTPKAPAPEAANDLASLEAAFDSEQGQLAATTVTSGDAPPAPGDGETDPPGPARPDAPPPEAPPPPADDVILRGNVSDVSFDEILEVLQLGEQSLVISFMRGDSQVGTLNLLSEQVLATTHGSLRGIEAFRRLSADHGETFEVRRATAVDATQALGNVTELLAGAQPAPQAAPDAPPDVPQDERPVFMQGRLSDFPLDLLIGSLDLSRQPIELVLRRGKTTLHRAQIKAGRITAALSTEGQGVDAALAAIRNDPGDEFIVYRCPELAGGPPVASLQALISETGPVRIPAPAAQSPAAPAGLETAIEEIRAALATLGPRRSGRALLWVVLALQVVCLVATGGLLALLILP